jgi:hypothetical protein
MIMQRLNEYDDDPYGREGRESRGFGAFYTMNQAKDATQVCADIVEQRREESEDSGLPTGNVTMPLPTGDIARPLREESPELSEEDLIEEEMKGDDLAQYMPETPTDGSDLNKRKNELRDRLAKLQARVEEVKKTVIDDEEDGLEEEYLEESYEESLDDLQYNVDVENFEEALENEAAIKIQALIRGFLVRCQLAHFFEMYELEYMSGEEEGDYESDEDSA